jgi:toxin-antitoxin system PIN domain toxin
LTKLCFPDVSVWTALSDGGHEHHAIATKWFSRLEVNDRAFFCRITQMGLLRMLTNRAVMGDEMLTEKAAWKVFDAWIQDARVEYIEEPSTLEVHFRAASSRSSASHARWTDDYLVAFAHASGLRFVTLDKKLQSLGHLLLLET